MQTPNLLRKFSNCVASRASFLVPSSDMLLTSITLAPLLDALVPPSPLSASIPQPSVSISLILLGTLLGTLSSSLGASLVSLVKSSLGVDDEDFVALARPDSL